MLKRPVLGLLYLLLSLTPVPALAMAISEEQATELFLVLALCLVIIPLILVAIMTPIFLLWIRGQVTTLFRQQLVLLAVLLPFMYEITIITLLEWPLSDMTFACVYIHLAAGITTLASAKFGGWRTVQFIAVLTLTIFALFASTDYPLFAVLAAVGISIWGWWQFSKISDHR